MLKVGLKGLLARKLRTALTGFAVVIGVAFVAGTFVFTDTIDASFKDLFERTSKGVDVNVQSRLAVELGLRDAAADGAGHAAADRVGPRRRRRRRLGRRSTRRCSTATASRSSPRARRR